MLGLAPLAAAPLSDDGDRLPRITAGAIGEVVLGGTAEGEARTAAVSPVAMLPVGGELAGVGRIEADGAGPVDVADAARAVETVVAFAAGSVTATFALKAQSAIAGATVHGLSLKGFSQGAVESAGAIDSSLGFDAVAQANVAHAVTLANGLRLNGYARADAISSARAAALGPGLAGRAFGSTLEARVAAMVGQIGISVSAQAGLATNAMGDASLAASMDARGNGTTRSAIAGALSISRELNAHVLASGQAGRQIGLTGAARGITATAADAAAARLEVTGASEARSGNLATMRHELSASGETELASAVSGAVIGTADWAGASEAITGNRAVVQAEASLQGTAFTANSIDADTTHALTILGNGAGDVRPVAQLRGHLGAAGGTAGAIASFGLGRGVFDVARSFSGDVYVFGDSVRAIGLAGQATVSSAAVGTVTTAGLVLTGSAAATSIDRSKAATQVSLSGEANSQVRSDAFVQNRLKIALIATGLSPQNGESNGAWATEGHVDGKLALMGSSDGALAIAAGASARGTLVARTSGVLALKGATTTALETRADAAGVLAIARHSDAAVVIDGDAYRSISLRGSSEGQASITAKPRLLPLTATLTAEADNAAQGRASSAVTTVGSGLAQVQSRAASQARLAISRTGAADVLILGAAWRGMPLLGISQALTPALAAANSLVMPGLAAAAANVIHLDLRAEAIAPGGQAAGSNLACAQDVSALWDFDMAAIAFRAPPALGRSEPPRLGLSGRLVPTNAGRILRG